MPRLTRRRFMQATGAAAAGAALAPLVDGVAATRAGASGGSGGGAGPNIVWICTDDERFDETWIMSKTTARLFNQATYFDGFMTSRPLCQPSRASFITGEYVRNHRAISNANNVGDPVLHSPAQLPVWLQTAGYYTAGLGKFLNSFQNNDAVPPGWDDFEGHCSTGSGAGANYVKWQINNNGHLESGKGYIEVENANRARTMMARWRANSTKPLFFYMGNTANHQGSGMVESVYGKLLKPFTPNWRPNFNELDVSDKPKAIRKLALLPASRINSIASGERQRLLALMGADDSIDALLTALGSDIANTVVIFTSDNGFMKGEHRVPWGKSVVYEESARVPLYIMGPGFPAGTTINSVCSGVDFAPTICALAGATPVGRTFDGRSLVDYVAHPELGLDRAVMIDDSGYRCVRTTNWKYVLHTTKEEELYDLLHDPYELMSQHANPAYAAVKAKLVTALNAIQNATGSACLVTIPPTAAFSALTSSLTVNVDGSSSLNLDSALTYAWDFGDGNVDTTSGVTASHAYTTRGTYTVVLTVTNARGASISTSHKVTVDQAPTASFNWVASGDTVTFDASGSTDTDGGSITNYAWNFGDGGTASGVSPQYSYAADGTYTVTLTVTDDSNVQGTTSQQVTVSSV
jgi:arylsulfatase A-like enzyme/chitodextrinase